MQSALLRTFSFAPTQAKELAADARASRVSDRLKTADELAAEKAAQLAELERKRQKRMRARGSDEEVSDEEDEDGQKGGYAARRQKRQKLREQRTDKQPRRETVRPTPSFRARATPHSLLCAFSGRRFRRQPGAG